MSDAWSDMTQVDYEYDEVGNCTKRKNNGSNDVETTYVANARGETKSITHNKSGDLYKLAYTRDGLGNPLQIAFTGSQFDEPYTNADTVRYSYDDTSRLTNQDWGYGDWTSVNSTSWSYDWVGNRGTGTDYNQADMYRKDNGYKYDYLGNTEYVPDSTSSTRTRYYYNGDNLLSQVDDVSGGNTTTTYLTWDGFNQRLKLARNSDTWEMICDPSADVPAVLLAKNYVSSSTTYMYYVREPDGALLCSFDASESPNKYYYHFDGLGSTVLVTNGNGSVSDSFAYGAWGDVVNSPTNDWQYQYVGRLGYYSYNSAQGTALAGLMQLGVRSYDEGTGRFTQVDPIPNYIERYSYANSGPTGGTDPSGLLCKCWTINSSSSRTVSSLVNSNRVYMGDFDTGNRVEVYAGVETSVEVGGEYLVIKWGVKGTAGVKVYRTYELWFKKYKVWELWNDITYLTNNHTTICLSTSLSPVTVSSWSSTTSSSQARQKNYYDIDPYAKLVQNPPIWIP